MEEALDKVKTSLKTLKEFKNQFQVDFFWKLFHPIENIFQEYKAKCPSYFKEDEDKEKEEEKDKEKDKDEDKEDRKVCKSWDFKEQLVFQRFDSFVERLKTIQDFCNTANQFLKLEKVAENSQKVNSFCS